MLFDWAKRLNKTGHHFIRLYHCLLLRPALISSIRMNYSEYFAFIVASNEYRRYLRSFWKWRFITIHNARSIRSMIELLHLLSFPDWVLWFFFFPSLALLLCVSVWNGDRLSIASSVTIPRAIEKNARCSDLIDFVRESIKQHSWLTIWSTECSSGNRWICVSHSFSNRPIQFSLRSANDSVYRCLWVGEWVHMAVNLLAIS